MREHRGGRLVGRQVTRARLPTRKRLPTRTPVMRQCPAAPLRTRLVPRPPARITTPAIITDPPGPARPARPARPRHLLQSPARVRAAAVPVTPFALPVP